MEKAMIYMYGTMLLVLTIPYQIIAAFTISPSSQVVGVGQHAVFRCQNLNALVIVWRVNETKVTSNIPHPDPGITVDTTIDENDNIINLLSIAAQLEYNETVIVCTAGSIGAGSSNDTTPVKLLIQGPLSMVTEINRNSSSITWVAPFSLDLTGVDPDIVYCVEVYNITCGVDDLVADDCDVTEPRFVDNRLQQGYVYHITITPRSNGQDAQNGTSNIKREIFTSLTNPRTSVMFGSRSTMVTAVIHFRDDGTGVKPASYFLNLTSIDGIEELSNTIFATSFTQDTNANSTGLRISELLPRQRLWKYQILALGCSEHPFANLFDISTHDFQNITVNSSRPGGISVTGDFIPGSLATGILIVVYSADDESNNTMKKYHFVHRSNIRRTITMTNLPSGRYEVLVFVVEENGLPFNRSATTPRNISLTERSDVQSSFKYQLHPTSTGICVNCTFLDNNSTGCVAVVHQRISQLSSSGLMNIESSHKFNRSGDTAYGCIEGVNLTDYQIGVFSLEEVVPTPPTSPDRVLDVRIIVTIIIVVVLLVAILFLATILIIVYYKKRILGLVQSIREYMQKKSRVSITLQRLTTDSSTSQTDDEETYDKLRGPVKQSQVAAKEEEALGSAPVYSAVGTHPPQSVTKEEGVGSTAIYNLLDNNPPQSVNPPQSDILYSSVKVNPPSSMIGHDDLHKTTTPYSELQQHKPQEESSSLKGPGNTYAVTRIDTVTGGDVLSDFNDEVVYIFNSAQEYVVPSELTTLLEETDDDDRHLPIICSW